MKLDTEKKPLLIIYLDEDHESLTLELSKNITFVEKLAVLSFLNCYVKDLEEDLRDNDLSLK